MAAAPLKSGYLTYLLQAYLSRIRSALRLLEPLNRALSPPVAPCTFASLHRKASEAESHVLYPAGAEALVQIEIERISSARVLAAERVPGFYGL